MKTQMLKLIVLLALFMGWFSCTGDLNDGFQWDSSKQQEEFRPVNQGEKSSYFKIDGNIISFAVPHLVGTIAYEYVSQPGWESPESLWSISLIMAEGTDVTSLSPVITLAPGATITWIVDRNDQISKQVDYTGIAEVGVYNFRNQVDFTVIASDGSTVTYMFLAVAIGDVLPCPDCP